MSAFQNKRHPAVTGRPAAAGSQSVAVRLATIKFGALVLAVLLPFASCATAPHQFSADPLDILGDDAPWYAVFPVEENRSVLEAFSRTRADGQSFMKNMERAEVLYLAGLSRDSSGDADIPFSLVATGSFPATMSGLAFSKKNGWIKKSSQSDGVWYQNGRMAVAIPRPGLLCMGTPETLPGMLDAVRNPAGGEVPVTGEFRALVPQSGTGDGTIALYVRDRQFIRDRVLKTVELELPVQGILAMARRNPESGNYHLVLRLFYPDERTARALLPLVRLVLTAMVKQDGTTQILEMHVGPEDIADLLSFVYF